MSLYCGIDLHSNNPVVVVINEEDRRLVEKRLPNELSATLKLLEPYRGEIAGVVVESTFNWYCLVDGLMQAGYIVKLANTTAEAAHYCVRFEPLARRFYERKREKTNDIVAIRATAHKLARAAYYMLRDQVSFDATRLFA